jgi:hypothetical protein
VHLRHGTFISIRGARHPAAPEAEGRSPWIRTRGGRGGERLDRTLRTLESNGYVVSKWDVDGSGPARRVYTLSSDGAAHLNDWTAVLEQMSKSMATFVKRARAAKT